MVKNKKKEEQKEGAQRWKDNVEKWSLFLAFPKFESNKGSQKCKGYNKNKIIESVKHSMNKVINKKQKSKGRLILNKGDCRDNPRIMTTMFNQILP